MNGDELAARLYSEQGYLVLSQNAPDPIGFIYRGVSDTNFPYRIVAEANEAEYLSQCHRAYELAPEITIHPKAYKPKRYFYRVEAAD